MSHEQSGATGKEPQVTPASSKNNPQNQSKSSATSGGHLPKSSVSSNKQASGAAQKGPSSSAASGRASRAQPASDPTSKGSKDEITRERHGEGKNAKADGQRGSPNAFIVPLPASAKNQSSARDPASKDHLEDGGSQPVSIRDLQKININDFKT